MGVLLEQACKGSGGVWYWDGTQYQCASAAQQGAWDATAWLKQKACEVSGGSYNSVTGECDAWTTSEAAKDDGTQPYPTDPIPETPCVDLWGCRSTGGKAMIIGGAALALALAYKYGLLGGR